MNEFRGRQEELQVLTASWNRSQQGTPQLVSIEGDSGLGKTRLAQEFYLSLAESPLNAPPYWPKALPDYERAMSLTPALESLDLEVTDHVVMPYSGVSI